MRKRIVFYLILLFILLLTLEGRSRAQEPYRGSLTGNTFIQLSKGEQGIFITGIAVGASVVCQAHDKDPGCLFQGPSECVRYMSVEQVVDILLKFIIDNPELRHKWVGSFFIDPLLDACRKSK